MIGWVQGGAWVGAQGCSFKACGSDCTFASLLHCTNLRLIAVTAHVVYQIGLGCMLPVHAQRSVRTAITAGCSTANMHHVVSHARLKVDLHCMVGQMDVMT